VYLFRIFALICEGDVREQQIHASEKYSMKKGKKLAEVENQAKQ
jgi:hypothetical protein